MIDFKGIPQLQRMTDAYFAQFLDLLCGEANGLYTEMPMTAQGAKVWRETLSNYLVRQVFSRLYRWYSQNQGKYPNLDDITAGLYRVEDDGAESSTDFTARPSYYRDLTRPLEPQATYFVVDPETAEADPEAEEEC